MQKPKRIEQNVVIVSAQIAEAAHRGIFRRDTGEPYIVHPGRIVNRAIFLPDVNEVVVGGLWVHDVEEDNPDFLGTELGCRIATPVYEFMHFLTNPSKQFPQLPRHERKRMDRKHIATVPTWPKVGKLLDRIDNVNDLTAHCRDNDFKTLYAHESAALLEAIYESSATWDDDPQGGLIRCFSAELDQSIRALRRAIIEIRNCEICGLFHPDWRCED